MNSKTTGASKPMKARLAQAERSEVMRRRLLDAATAVLNERGLVGFRTAEVAELAGVSKGALLHHFPTKVRLIAAVLERLYEAAGDTARVYQPKSTLAETIKDLISDSHAYFFSESFDVTLNIIISAARDPELKSTISEVVWLFRKQTEAVWTERLTAHGLSRERAHDAVWLVNSAVRGLAVRALWEPDQPLFQRLERITASIMTEHLSKPDEVAQGSQ
jgi:AcrR family transcriptional regulator